MDPIQGTECCVAVGAQAASSEQMCLELLRSSLRPVSQALTAGLTCPRDPPPGR